MIALLDGETTAMQTSNTMPAIFTALYINGINLKKRLYT